MTSFSAFDFVYIFYGKKYTYTLHIMFVELVAIPTSIMTIFTVVNLVSAVVSVGQGIVVIAPLVMELI
jgi:hypothetical protein